MLTEIAPEPGRLPMRLSGDAQRLADAFSQSPPPPNPHTHPAEPAEAAKPWTPTELDNLLAGVQQEEMPEGARHVVTPDGPMVLTPPPFALKPTIMSPRERQYARAISIKLPSGYVVCPQVRLDALVTPRRPAEGMSAEEWRTWRKRVRLRAVDFVICALPEWRPVVAIEIEPQERGVKPFQRDRIEDEVFAVVGLPLVRCSGTPGEDWGMIAPYVKARAGSRSASLDPDGTGAG